MSVEITFPLEFVVEGTPVSLQAKRPASRLAWTARIREASRAALPEGHFLTEARLAVTLFHFPVRAMQGDIDNIVKPVLDALCRHIYHDDRQVERVWVQKFEPEREFGFPHPSTVLSDALDRVRRDKVPVLYVRLTDDVAEGLG